MAGYTRMVPHARTKVGEIELECNCGGWLPYPGDDGNDEAPSRCPDCESEWYVMDAIARPKKRKKKARST